MSRHAGLRRRATTALAAATLVFAGCGQDPGPPDPPDATPLVSGQAAAALQERVAAAEEAAAAKDWSQVRGQLREVRQLVNQFEQAGELDPGKAVTILQAVDQLEAHLPVTAPPSEDVTTPPPSDDGEDDDDDGEAEED